MTFANPLSLFGLLVVPLIIILHLLRERRRRQVVSNINLWAFLEEEVRGPKPQRMPITLLLILDLLIGLLLLLAWAQPQIKLYIPVEEARHVVILIDVSASMQTRDRLPNRLAQAALEVSTLVNGLDAHDIATIITFGKGVTWLADTRQVDFPEVLSRLTDLKAVEIGHEIDAALVMGLSALDGNFPTEFHVFTDAAFPLNRPETENNWEEFPYPIIWHKYPGETDNQAVMDVTVQVVAEDHLEVFARVANFGYQSVNRVVALVADGKPIDSTTIEIPPESTVTHLWKLNGQATVITVALAGGDKYSVDDTFTTGVTPFKNVRVVYVTEDPSPIDQAIQAIPGTELTIFSPQEYSPHIPADLTIFRGTLPQSWPEGVVLLVEPPEDQGMEDSVFPPRLKHPNNIALNVSLQVPGYDPLIEGMDFASIRWVRVWELSEFPENFSTIVQVGDTPILLHSRQGNSDVIVLLAHLQSGNFTKDPAFIVLFANIVNSVHQTILPQKLPLDHPIPLPEESKYQLLRISNPMSETVEFRGNWPSVWQETSLPGTYMIEMEDKDGESFIHAVGINAADECESDLGPKEWMTNLVKDIKPDVSAQDIKTEQQFDLMPYLLIAVLFFLLLEALLAWR
jgi:Ca-activated chloride channel family protein